MKLLSRLVFVLLLACLALGVHAWFAWSPGAPSYVLAAEARAEPLPMRFRDGAEHDAVRAAHPEPYVLELAQGNGALLYYGAHHDDDPASAQQRDIRGRWEAFRPTVALCEGRARGYLVGPVFALLAGRPESALVHELARKGGVPLWSLEPEYADEVALLSARFQPAELALFYTLRVYWSESEGQSDEALAEELRAKRSDVEGLRGALPDLAAMDASWRAIQPDGDWRAWTGEMPGVLREIDDASRAARGEHMARVLLDLVRRGERVFAVVGSGHVIRQEWALRAALGAEPAADEPSR